MRACLLVLALLAGCTSPESPVDLAEATCLGATTCRACKTCKYCAHCAKQGGTCGVCKH